MLNAEFNKETFKNSVKENVKMLYRKNLEEASQQEIYQAVCYAVKDVIIDNWLKPRKQWMSRIRRFCTICPWSS